MTPVRLTVAMLLGVVACFAVALAALRSASVGWTLVAFLLQWVVLLTIVMGLWFTRAASRSPWIGALIFGGGFFLATSPNLFLTNPGNYLSSTLGEIFEQIHPSPPTTYIPQTLAPEETFKRQVALNLVSQAHYSHQNRFTSIATSYLVIAFAVVGSHVGRAFAWRRQVAASPPPTEPGTDRNP